MMPAWVVGQHLSVPVAASWLTWQRPELLLALPTALLPLWFVRRRRDPPPVVLPTASLLEGLTTRRRWSADVALTLARMAMLAMLVLAFAGPRHADSPGDAASASRSVPAAGPVPAAQLRSGDGRVILIAGRASAAGEMAAADLLERALVLLQDDAGPWRVRRVNIDALDAAALSEADQLWLVDAQAVVSKAVVDFVAGGGSLLATFGAVGAPIAREPDFWPLAVTAERNADAPWPQISAATPPGSAIPPQLAAALSQAVVRPRYHTRLVAGAAVHLTLADGQPVVAERAYGRGRVVALTLDLALRGGGSARADVSDLARRGTFVWLTHWLAEHLHTPPADAPRASPKPAGMVVEAMDKALPLTAMLLAAAWVAWAMERVILARRACAARAGELRSPRGVES